MFFIPISFSILGLRWDRLIPVWESTLLLKPFPPLNTENSTAEIVGFNLVQPQSTDTFSYYCYQCVLSMLLLLLLKSRKKYENTHTHMDGRNQQKGHDETIDLSPRRLARVETTLLRIVSSISLNFHVCDNFGGLERTVRLERGWVA